jgi:hypothetical protein
VYHLQAITQIGHAMNLANKCSVAVLLALIANNGVGEQGSSNESKDRQMITIRAQDIPKTVQILGRLGQPLGSLLTVRGKWTRPGINMKDRSLVFHVTLANGKEPDGKVDLHSLLVKPILSDHKGREPKSGELWDWRFDWEGSKPGPTPSEGETWEMLGVETGCFNSYSGDAWREIGSSVPQSPPCMEGFYTPFEYIAVRKLK